MSRARRSPCRWRSRGAGPWRWASARTSTARHLHDPSEVLQLRREHRLQRVMPALQDLLADDSSSGRHLLVLTDASGETLWRVGSREALRRADRLEFSEDADWSEAGIGTNAISQALVTGGPVQLFSAEHLVCTHHDWTCTAAPITTL